MQWENKGSTNGSSYNWHKQNPTFWKQFYDQMKHMKQIYFAGGESLIIEEHYEILEEAIRQGLAPQLEIRYNSNGVEWREDLFELWSHFKLVRFHYSVDSIEQMNEYIRYPSKWDRTREVFHILDKQTTDNVEVTVACAVQALNIYYIPDFIKWKMKEGFKKINMWPFGAGMINYHFVYWPAHLIQLGGFSPLSICLRTLHIYLLFQAVSKSTTFRLLGRPSSSFSIPTWPPCSLSLVGPTELAFAVQQTRILPSGLVLKCTQGKIQKVSLGESVIVIPQIFVCYYYSFYIFLNTC